ncbi:MAG: hypothetical protein ABSC46_07535 [Candidatus Limnocylindrales bacterium]|jgi:hypothetical protein
MFRRRDRRDKAEAPDEVLAADEDREDAEDEVVENELEDQPEDMTADLESQAADYLADNDAWMYGPNAEAVLEILDRLEELTPAEARPLAEAWLAIPKSDRDRARKAARKLGEDDLELGRHLQLAREAVGTWMAVTGPFPEFVNADPEWGRLCTQSGEAALDAATAVILEGRLEEIHYESLLEPWEEAMAGLDAAAEATRLESPAEDETEDEEVEEEEEQEDQEEFGPNADSVTDFLNRLWLLTPEQVGRLVGGWQNVDRDDLRAAHEGLRAVADEDPEWRDQVRHAQDKLAPWLNAGRIQETSGFLGQTGQGESRKMAGPALADAVAALVLGDVLDRKDAETLYGPWLNLIGAPPLPVAEEEAPKSGKAAKGAGGKKAASGAGKPGPSSTATKAAPKAAKPGPAGPKPAPAAAKASKTAGKSTSSRGKSSKK